MTSPVDNDLTPSAPAQTFAHMQERTRPLGPSRGNQNATVGATQPRMNGTTAAELKPMLEGGPAPAFSKSSLYEIGLVEGLTPPALASLSAVGTSPVEVSSVVTAGLEMGLGVSLASSALMTHIPGAQAAALSSLAEPRYSRPHQTAFEPKLQDGFETEVSPTSRVDFDLSETTSAAVSLPYRNRAYQNPDFVEDGPDGDLHRRRTTGARQTKQRMEPMRLGRHHRADTHDPIISSEPPPTSAAEIAKQQYYQNNYIAFRNEANILTHGLPSSFNADAPLSATTSAEPEPSLGGRSSTHAHASFGGSTQLETPSIGDKAMLSPDSHHPMSGNPFATATTSSSPVQYGTHANDAAGWKSIKRDLAAGAHGPTQAALLGLGGGSHFGPGVRAKVSEVLPHLVSSIPLSGEEGETITIAEYGSLNTRSINLMQPIISSFVEKAHADTPRREMVKGEDAGDYFPGLEGAASLRSILGVDASADYPCKVNFSIIHEDSPQADFRPLSQMLESNPESYLHPQWQATHEPPLHNAIFPSFVSRPFASRIAPPSTLHLGISLMDLHWSHTPRNPTVSLSTSAHAELAAFFTARAHEFRKGGVIVIAFIARSEDSNVVLPDRPRSTVHPLGSTETERSAASLASHSGVVDPHAPDERSRIPMLRKERRRSNSSPDRPSIASNCHSADTVQRPSDIWSTLTNTLAPCLQRLVSCGMLKSDVARHLLSLPMHARTPRQTRNVLKSVKHLWKVEWSCGLGDEPVAADAAPALPCEAEPLRLPHPAWKALQAGTLSRVAFAEHMIQLFKNLYESHFRAILREKANLSKGAVEFVLDSLWDVLQSRIDDQEPCPIAECELEVQVVALRRI
ncbi:uncharacterized protein MEPE_01312 [Melanopsichium pennsylvanicum]|uniref:Uncharacterized protein n=2 Tax=Melanopsichium pennsylvanicum TaxID=63383 RepID=A0AAJ5C3G4_9BASI|nr:putative protein [Melanopsichium pennsylvanicum 4]SNX82606.1 uncharacterized protein MEPE_01312 [Melanopsichium pennsylvanicum]